MYQKIIIFISLCIYSSIAFSAEEPKEISCDEVIATLSSDNSISWEDFDSNGVRSNYGTEFNKWEQRSAWGEAVLSNNGICMYSWKISSLNNPDRTNPYQYLIYYKNGEPKYYAHRLITKSLVRQAENDKKNTIANTNQVAINSQAVTQNVTNSQNNLDEYNKAIEDAKKAIALKQASIVPIDIQVSTPTNIKTKKLSPVNEKKATLMRKRIQLLKKQLEILEKQLESL